MAEYGFMKKVPGFATKAIHAGQDPDNWKSGCVVPPIVTAMSFKQDGPGDHRGFEYGRSANPTRNMLEECLAALENGKHGMCFSSGLGAATCIASILSPGDHIVCGDDMYGGTNRLFSQYTTRMGIEVTFVDLQEPSDIKKALTPNTKMVWVESPTNPLLKLVDIAAVAGFLKARPDIFMVVDNTFLTPYLQRPLELGADIVMYSLTKYMNGHSDVIMGAAITNRDDLHERIRFSQNALGVIPAPFDCYQVNRGLKTLAIRMDQHMKSAIEIAKWMETHNIVEKVMHPGLPSHPQHELAKKQSYGHSGMVSFSIKGSLKEASAFLKALKVFTLAGSLGGYGSLASLPSIMTHAAVPAEQKLLLGITDTIIRLSVGLEDTQDLIDDIAQALQVASEI